MWILVAAVYIVPLFAVRGALDIFIKIGSIDGEGIDPAYTNWIVGRSYEWGMHKPVVGTGTGRTTRATEHQDFSVTKYIDKSSPALMLYACDGKHIPECTVVVRHAASGNTQATTEYAMSDVIVTDAKPQGSTEGTGIPTDQLSFNYAKVEVRYTVRDVATGATNFHTNVVCEVE